MTFRVCPAKPRANFNHLFKCKADKCDKPYNFSKPTEHSPFGCTPPLFGGTGRAAAAERGLRSLGLAQPHPSQVRGQSLQWVTIGIPAIRNLPGS
jgi:hypothetical protein